MTTDVAFESGAPFSRNGIPQATDDDPINYSFAGVAAHMTLGDGFIMSEYGVSSVEEVFAPDGNVNGYDGDTGWYISAGRRFGNVTPHITYATNTSTRSKELPSLTSDGDDSSESWTVGLRWDFHPSAAFKFEYTTRSEESDDEVKDSLGFGYGDSAELDLISAGIDIIF